MVEADATVSAYTMRDNRSPDLIAFSWVCPCTHVGHMLSHSSIPNAEQFRTETRIPTDCPFFRFIPIPCLTTPALIMYHAIIQLTGSK